MAPLGALLVWLISLLWFRKITAGMLKAIRGKDPAASGGSEHAAVGSKKAQ